MSHFDQNQMQISRRVLIFAGLFALESHAKLAFDVPANACDCHTHIFGSPKRFPLWPGRVYTPELALPKAMASLHRKLRMQRVVVVTPSVYGTDNSATIWGMKARGGNARGIAVIDAKTSESELDAMDRAGMRGIRLNLAMDKLTIDKNDETKIAIGRLQAAIERVRRRGWHVQIFTSPTVIAGIRQAVMESPVPVVFDHFGGAKAALGLEQPGLSELLSLVRSGKAYVKISGAYRASSRAPFYEDASPLAKAFIAANPERVIWGTDWPHPDSVPPASGNINDVTPLLRIDDETLLNQLAVWAPDASVRRQILVENPARLYKF